MGVLTDKSLLYGSFSGTGIVYLFQLYILNDYFDISFVASQVVIVALCGKYVNSTMLYGFVLK